MKWLTVRAFNRFDGFTCYFIGYMMAAQSWWWFFAVVPTAIISATLEYFYDRSANNGRAT